MGPNGRTGLKTGSNRPEMARNTGALATVEGPGPHQGLHDLEMWERRHTLFEVAQLRPEAMEVHIH